MKITLVQSDIAWENKKANFNNYEILLEKMEGKTDIIVLPEMFNTGFSMNSAMMAEDMKGETLGWMRKLSERGNFGMIGSFIVSENAKFFNRLVFMKPDGTFSFYDKGHLFRMEKENRFYTRGHKTVIDSFRGWRFSLQICYDLRFPVWSRIKNNNYDILVYIANWPASRRTVWNTLLRARAIENQSYVVGVNRIGKDGNDIDYCGDSVILDPKGVSIAETEQNREEVLTAEISLDYLETFRKKFPVWKDADDFELLSD